MGISYVTISPRWAGLTAADFLQASMSIYTDDRICFKRTIGITKKSRTIPAHTYKEAQKDKKKASVPIQLSGWLRTLDMVAGEGLEPTTFGL